MQKDAVNGVDGLGDAIHVTVSPEGKHVYAIGYLDNAVVVFSRDSSTGALTYVEMQKGSNQYVQYGVGGVDGLNGARSVAVSPDGKHVYATGYLDNTVVVFSRNVLTGALTYVEMQQDGLNGVDGLNGAYSVAVSPDGKHVYAIGHIDDAVAVFYRNLLTGALTYVEMQKDGLNGVDGLNGANSVTVSPDGMHVYAAGRFDNAVAAFSRNSSTGTLTYVEMQKDGVNGVDGLNGSNSVTVSPDGNHVYATGYLDDAVAVFSRNSSTGALTYLEMQKDGLNGVDGLNGAKHVTLSPDGRHVYAAGRLDNAVAVFSRNSSTGALTYVEMQKDGLNGVDGLNGAVHVTLSPDGRHVYAAGRLDNAVAVFSRNSSTGALTYVEMQKDGLNGVDGLDNAIHVTVSPDGNRVYATGYLDDAVAVFSRNVLTGTLTYVEMQKDGVGEVDGLGGAHSVTVSPDGRHVYAAANIDDAVAVFSRN